LSRNGSQYRIATASLITCHRGQASRAVRGASSPPRSRTRRSHALCSAGDSGVSGRQAPVRAA
jgi:hypothetical protein